MLGVTTWLNAQLVIEDERQDGAGADEVLEPERVDGRILCRSVRIECRSSADCKLELRERA